MVHPRTVCNFRITWSKSIYSFTLQWTSSSSFSSTLLLLKHKTALWRPLPPWRVSDLIPPCHSPLSGPLSDSWVTKSQLGQARSSDPESAREPQHACAWGALGEAEARAAPTVSGGLKPEGESSGGCSPRKIRQPPGHTSRSKKAQSYFHCSPFTRGFALRGVSYHSLKMLNEKFQK